jgi:hypothetical protein
MANYPTTAWDETAPAATDDATDGDDKIREMKTQVREVIGRQHQMASSGADTDGGEHLLIAFQSKDSFTDADTTPNVSASSYFLTANTGATSITDFDTMADFQLIIIQAGDGNTTLVHSAALVLNGAANWTMATGDTITLIYDGSNWYEIARSNNT